MERITRSSPQQVLQSLLPEPTTLGQFLENPREFRPKTEYVNATFLVEDDTVLTHSIKFQNVAAVEVLLKAGADANMPSRKGIAPISGAAHKGNTSIMKLLIAYGAKVNSPNSTGSTALIQASHFGHLEAVKLLLYHKADSDSANQKGTTALMRASQEGHVEISKCLIESGVDVNKKNLEGMNALMLASQRGHANIVYVLVRAGATMDEQTAQGSTALMLACKRGHEKCAEVLVSMGAEIYMRDRRNRTARDTATRRNHHALLCWLDTQMQVKRIQEGRHRQRTPILIEQREANQHGLLRLNSTLDGVSKLYGAVQRLERNSYSTADPLREADEQVLEDFTNNMHVFSVAATTAPQNTLEIMRRNIQAETSWNAEILSQPIYRASTRMALRQQNYSDWQWPYLLQRCMSLPSGLYEHVMEYIPMPRVWQWSLLHLKRRCKLAPHQAVLDMSIIIDEILTDAAIFAGADQRFLLIKLNRSPQIHSFLLEKLHMPVALLDTLCDYADTQSLLQRVTDQEITFKPTFARNMLNTVVELYRWYRTYNTPLKLLDLQPHVHITPAALMGLHRSGTHTRKSSAGRSGTDGSDDGMETTDIAGEEEEEGQEDGEESDFDGEFALAEPDTGDEMVVDDNAQMLLEDSDSGGEQDAQVGNAAANLFAVGF